MCPAPERIDGRYWPFFSSGHRSSRLDGLRPIALRTDCCCAARVVCFRAMNYPSCWPSADRLRRDRVAISCADCQGSGQGKRSWGPTPTPSQSAAIRSQPIANSAEDLQRERSLSRGRRETELPGAPGLVGSRSPNAKRSQPIANSAEGLQGESSLSRGRREAGSPNAHGPAGARLACEKRSQPIHELPVASVDVVGTVPSRFPKNPVGHVPMRNL